MDTNNNPEKNSNNIDPKKADRLPWETPQLIIENTDQTMVGAIGSNPNGDDGAVYFS